MHRWCARLKSLSTSAGFTPNASPHRFLTTALQRTHFDMIIVGGGMVGFGLAAATAASRVLREKNVLLLETSSHRTYQMHETYEPRTVAINAASQKFLSDVGAWDFITSKRLQSVNKMKVWESRSDSFLTFERNPLAYIIENNLVIEALRQSILQHSDTNLSVLYNAQASMVKLPTEARPDELVTVEVQCEQEGEVRRLETSLLVGADGASSKVRQFAHLKTIGWDHGQTAVVAILRMGEGHEESTAWQRFTTTGPIALLPLSSEYSCLIWSTTNAEADRLMLLSDKEFVHDLNVALTTPNPPTSKPVELLGTIGQSLFEWIDSACGQPKATRDSAPRAPYIEGLQSGTGRFRYPLGFSHANFYHAPRVALVGDAAHRILPLAGQGVNLGFGDIMSLARHLEKAILNGADIGSTAYLKDYTSDRQRAVLPVAALMEALNALYSNDAMTSKLCNVPGRTGATEKFPILYAATQLLTGLRAAGLRSVESSSLIKNFLMQAAVTGQLGWTELEK